MKTRDVINALQELHRNVPGVRIAPDLPPNSLNLSDLPAVFVIPGECEHLFEGIGRRKTVRMYRVIVFCAPVASGRDGEGISKVADMLPEFAEIYFATRFLQDENGSKALIHIPFSDTGHVIETFAGIDYHAFTYRLRIQEDIQNA